MSRRHPPSVIDLSKEFDEVFGSRPRRLARYNVSDIWAIQNKYLTVRTFFKLRPPTLVQVQGIWKHKMIQELLQKNGYSIEPKREMSFGEWTLVGKADAVKDGEGLEIKTSNSASVMMEAKRWHIYQARILCSLFELSRCLIVQPIVANGKLKLIEIGKGERDDVWFNWEMDKVGIFHESLKNYVQHSDEDIKD